MKIITTAEGGLATTNNLFLAERRAYVVTELLKTGLDLNKILVLGPMSSKSLI